MMNLDRSFFQVFINYGRRGICSVEIDAGMTREEIVAMVAGGEYAPREVVCVLESNPIEHSCNDITEDFLFEVAVMREARGLQAAE